MTTMIAIACHLNVSIASMSPSPFNRSAKPVSRERRFDVEHASRLVLPRAQAGGAGSVAGCGCRFPG
jgi:hypothetical protein